MPFRKFGIEWRYDVLVIGLSVVLTVLYSTHTINATLQTNNVKTVGAIKETMQQMQQGTSVDHQHIMQRFQDLEARQLEVQTEVRINNDRIKEMLAQTASRTKPKESKDKEN
jgi:hypothetical protein